METDTEHNNIDTPGQFFLRVPDGQEYGPADLETIADWCREARITPDQEISSDRQVWTPVTEVPELEFDWILILEDGSEAGPFHWSMLKEQIQQGNVPLDAICKNRHTDEHRSVHNTTFASEAEIAPMTAMPDDEEKIVADDSREDPTEDAPLPTSARIETLVQNAAAMREKLQFLQSEQQTLKMEKTLLEDQRQHLEERLQACESEKTAAESNLLEMQNIASQNETELDNLRAQLSQLEEHYEKLQVENQRQFEKIDDMHANALRAEQTWKNEIAVLGAKLDSKQRTITEIANVLSEHHQLPVYSENAKREVSAPPRPASNEKLVESANVAKVSPAEKRTKEKKPQRPQLSHPPAEKRKGRQAAVILLVLISLLVMMFGIYSRQNANRATSLTGNTTDASADTNVITGTEREPTELLVPNEALELQPESTDDSDDSELDIPATAWPDLSLPNHTVSRDGNTMRITFSYGLFSSGTRLHDQARVDLRAIADSLRKQIDSFTIIIEGHTDAVPVRPGNDQFVDNFSLGMARAQTVKKFFVDEAGLPAKRIHTSSAGQASSPYPNDSEENRARNRTATISIIP